MDFRSRWCPSRSGCQELILSFVLIFCVIHSESSKSPQYYEYYVRPQRPLPLQYEEESDFHYDGDEYEGEDEEFSPDYEDEREQLPYRHFSPHHNDMVDKHMLGYYNFNKHAKPGFQEGHEFPPPPPPYYPSYDDGYYPSYDSDQYLPPSGPELPPIYRHPPGAPEPPFPPPPFGSPDPGFKSQTGFEGFLVPNSWYGLLPWGIEGVIIVIAGIIIFVIIVIAIISVIAWLCAARKVGEVDKLESRMYDAWGSNENADLLARLSEQVLSAVEKYETKSKIV